MERTSLASWPCPIARAMDQIFGIAWSVLIMRDVLLGTRRFADLQAGLDIATNILTRRLATLVRHGLLEKRAYATRPPRHEYVPTRKGEDLLPLLLAISAWGNAWLAPKGEPLVPVDAKTGVRLRPVVVDERSHKRLLIGKVALIAGPGAPDCAAREPEDTARVFAGRRVP